MQGLKGIHKCACGFEVWGVASNTPGNWLSQGHNSGIPTLPYNFEHPQDYTWPLSSVVTSEDKDIIPELFERETYTGFPMYAAKVRSSYPGIACDKFPVPSSHADGTFSVELALANFHDVSTAPDPDFHFMRGYRPIFGSRVVYVDGAQTFVIYRLQGGEDVGFGYDDAFSEYDLQDWHQNGVRDIAIVNIHDQTKQLLLLNSHGGYSAPNSHELYLARILKGADNITVSNFAAFYAQQPANSYCLGKDYAIFSSYEPGREAWGVGRVTYVSTRYRAPDDPEYGTDPTITPGDQTFASYTNAFFNGDVGTDHEGEYAILLPAVRSYIDSANLSGEGDTDECWVCAKTCDSGPQKLIVAQWLEDVFRTGYATYDAGRADGTLHADDVANGLLVVDPDDTDLTTLFPDETWENIHVWAYNRCYDRRSGTSKHLLLFTTQLDVLEGENDTPLVNFEDDLGDNDDFDLNIDFPEGVAFETFSSVGAGFQWSVDTSDSNSGDFSARCEDNKSFAGTTTLRVTLNILEGSTSNISFWYRHDNRRHAATFPHAILNLPEVDNTFTFSVDGDVKLTVTNSDFTTEAEFEDWYEFDYYAATTEYLPAGTHTFAWKFNRVWASNNPEDTITGTWLDDIQFPQIMVGNDFSGAKRWYFDGTRVRSADYWAWAKRNEEGTIVPGTPDDISERVSTIPESIAFDSEGDILYGNPHYVVRIRMDEGHEGELDDRFGGPRGEGSDEADKGYVRWTARASVEVPENPCADPDERYDQVDVISDPPWGAFQILPVGHRDFQVRGTNSTYQDATVWPPLNTSLFKYKDPVDGTLTEELFRHYLTVRISNGWPQRIQGWTIKQNGTVYNPHVETIWRPTMHQMAWPEAGPYDSPPYRADFETANPDDADMGYPLSFNQEHGFMRMRNELALAASDQEKPKWSNFNYIVPASYSDTFMQLPQTCWIRITRDPPNDEENPDYWVPGGPVNVSTGQPWGSAKWGMHQLRFCPTGACYFWLRLPEVSDDEEGCDQVDEEGVVPVYFGRIAFQDDLFGPITDFDAVDCGCSCGCG